MSEGKIAPAILVYAGHFSGMGVFQAGEIASALKKLDGRVEIKAPISSS